MCPLTVPFPVPTMAVTSCRVPSSDIPKRSQDAGRDPVGLAEQPEQDVLGADVVVLQPPGLFLGQHDGVPGAVSESLKHVISVQHASNPVNTMLLIG